MKDPIISLGKNPEEGKISRETILPLGQNNNYMVREIFPCGIICTVKAIPGQEHSMKVEPDYGYDIPDGTTMASTYNKNASSSLALMFMVVNPNMDSKSFSLRGKINPSTDLDNSSVVTLSLEEIIQE